MTKKIIGLTAAVCLMLAISWSIKENTAKALTYEELKAHQQLVLGQSTYASQTLVSNVSLKIILTPMEYKNGAWQYRISWKRTLNSRGSLYVNNKAFAATAQPDAEYISGNEFKPGVKYKLEFYSQPNKGGVLLARKYFTAPAAPDEALPAPVACTQEAKLCPDGKTYVSRTGPACEFSACPETNGKFKPFMWLDQPKNKTNLSGTVQIAGWALDSKEQWEGKLSKFEVLINGTLAASWDNNRPLWELGNGQIYGIYRPDVCPYLKLASLCQPAASFDYNRTGFDYGWNTTTVKNGQHIITLRAYDNDTSPNVVETSFTVTVSNPTQLPYFKKPALSFVLDEMSYNGMLNMGDTEALKRVIQNLKQFQSKYEVYAILGPTLKDKSKVYEALDLLAANNIPFILDQMNSIFDNDYVNQIHDPTHRIGMSPTELNLLKARYGANFAGLRFMEVLAMNHDIIICQQKPQYWCSKSLPYDPIYPGDTAFRIDLIKEQFEFLKNNNMFGLWSDWRWSHSETKNLAAYPEWQDFYKNIIRQGQNEEALRQLIQSYPNTIVVMFANNWPAGGARGHMDDWQDAIKPIAKSGAIGFGLSDQAWMCPGTNCPIDELITWATNAFAKGAIMVDFQPFYYFWNYPTFSKYEWLDQDSINTNRHTALDPAWTGRGYARENLIKLGQALGVSISNEVGMVGLPPTTRIDSPSQKTLKGVVNINGWAIDNMWQYEGLISSAELYINNSLVASYKQGENGFYGTNRPDVCSHFKLGNNCPANVGYNYAWDTTKVPNGQYVIKLVVTDNDNDALGKKTLTQTYTVSVQN